MRHDLLPSLRVHIEGQEYEVTTNSIKPIMSPTETDACTPMPFAAPIDLKLAELHAEVIAANESIKNQDHIIWLAKVEKSKQKAILNATHAAIEAITKPKGDDPRML